MVKIFVGNLGDEADPEKLKKLFEDYGTVTECDILNRFGFVHMDSEAASRKAIENLHHSLFGGKQINVELSTGGAPRRDSDGGGRGGGGRRGRGRERGGRGRSDRYDPYPPRSYYDDPYDRDRYERRPPPPRDHYRDPYYDRDPYGRYPPPERDPYARYPPPERDPYYRRRDPYGRPPPPPYEGDPYARPPPEYYYESLRAHERPPPHYDPYYEHSGRRAEHPPPRGEYPPESAEGEGYPSQEKAYEGYAESAPAEGHPSSYRGGRWAGSRRGGAGGSNGNAAPDPTNLYMSFE